MNKYRFHSKCSIGFGGLDVRRATLSAQQAPSGGVPAHMIVTVEPHHGSDVPVVNREDVMVYEGKDRDTVTEWIPAQGDHAALEFFVLLDDGSDANLGSQLDDIRKFINATAGFDQDRRRVHAERHRQDRTESDERSCPGGEGDPAAHGNPRRECQPVFFPKRSDQTLAGDHRATGDRDGLRWDRRYYGTGDLQDPYLEQAIADAERAGIVVSAIYTPGVGHFAHSYWQNYWGQLYLAQMAERTGGEAYYIGFTRAPVSFDSVPR